MRKLWGVAPLIAVALLAGCSGESVAVATSSATATVALEETPKVAVAPTLTPTSSPTSTASALADAAPVACVDYEGAQIGHADGGEAIAAAASQAALHPLVVLNPGVQTVVSTDKPGMIDAVARICSNVMSKSDVIAVANAIAVSIKGDPSSDILSVLIVQAWHPGADGFLSQGESVTTDFQSYTWDASASAVPLDINWD